MHFKNKQMKYMAVINMQFFPLELISEAVICFTDMLWGIVENPEKG